MKVLSLFDGISGCQQALKNLGIVFDGVNNVYYASEVDKYAIQATQKNFPNTVQLGDVRNARLVTKCVDLLCGGSPCQDLSSARTDRKGLEGTKSGLFWEYVRILQETKPAYFLLENVASMSKKDKDIISQALGVQPILLNSSLLTAQHRARLYWTNILNVHCPKDRGLGIKDYVEGSTDYIASVLGVYSVYNQKIRTDKFYTLGTTFHQQGSKTGQLLISTLPFCNSSKKLIVSNKYTTSLAPTGFLKKYYIPFPDGEYYYRPLTPVEGEALQGFPSGFTGTLSTTQRCKAVGNSFTIPIIEFILQNITNSSL